jgi:hypothetical protein
VREYGVQYAGIEGALWRTLGLLLFRPGQLTVEYLHGRRRRYLHPIRLYLTTSIVCFLLLQLGSAVHVDRNKLEQAALQDVPEVSIDLGLGTATLKSGGGFECSMAGWICERLKRRYAVDPQRLAVELEGVQTRFVTFLPYAMFLLVPLFATLIQLAYWRRRMHYAEHLVFALHLHAFWFTGIGINTVVPDAVAGVLSAFFLAYGVLAMRRVYGGRWRFTLLRAAAVTPAYLIAILTATVAVAMVAVLT